MTSASGRSNGLGALDQVLGDLARGGISIVTRLDDGTIGAHLVIQLDGDAINRVSPRFLRDPAAQERHAGAIAAFLAQWRRARWLTSRTLTVITFGVFASLLAAHPTWEVLGVSGVAPFALRWCARLALGKATSAVLRRVVR
jgi:hypothetical protein